jgi:hypothetical protein
MPERIQMVKPKLSLTEIKPKYEKERLELKGLDIEVIQKDS